MSDGSFSLCLSSLWAKGDQEKKKGKIAKVTCCWHGELSSNRAHRWALVDLAFGWYASQAGLTHGARISARIARALLGLLLTANLAAMRRRASGRGDALFFLVDDG